VILRCIRLLAVALAVATVACGHTSSRTARTQLTIRAIDSLARVHVFRMRCVPAGGDIPARTACAALRRTPTLLRDVPDVSTCGQGRGPRIEVSGVDRGRKVTATFGCSRSARRARWLGLLPFSDVSAALATIHVCCASERPPTCDPRPPRAALDGGRQMAAMALAPVRAAFWVRGRRQHVEQVLSGAGIPDNPAVVAVLAVGRFRFVTGCAIVGPCPTQARLLEAVFDARTGRSLGGGGGNAQTVPDLNRLGQVHDLLPYLDGRCPARS
jgi:hypothetical protein